MAPNTFGVTISDLQGVVSNFTISAQSSPTTTQVEEIISYAAAGLELEAASVGVDLQGLTDSTDSMYMLYKRAIVYRSAADVLTAKNRGNTESGKYYMDLYKELVDTLRTAPDRVASRGTDTGPARLKYLTRVAMGEDPYVAGTVRGKIVFGDSL